MAILDPALLPPPSRPSPAIAPTLSAIRSSPLSSGSLGSYPITTASFTSSPTLSSTQRDSSPSPDFLRGFVYSQEMDDDFSRVDREFEAERLRDEFIFSQAHNRVLVSESPPPAPRDQKTWVVFHGKVPGIYEDYLSAAMQTQGFSDGFQRTFPDRDSAEAAWSAYVRYKAYPDYGIGPWVVFIGRKPGVAIKVTELECSVKGYAPAIFRSCSSIPNGTIKFQIFAERVAQMFTDPNLFSSVDALISQPERVCALHETVPAVTPATPVPMPQNRPRILAEPQVAESSNSASKRNASSSSLVASLQRNKTSLPGDGWYVAHHAVLPGVCYGVNALRRAEPVPGGFQCASNRESADQLFHDLSINGAIVWAHKE